MIYHSRELIAFSCQSVLLGISSAETVITEDKLAMLDIMQKLEM